MCCTEGGVPFPPTVSETSTETQTQTQTQSQTQTQTQQQTQTQTQSQTQTQTQQQTQTQTQTNSSQSTSSQSVTDSFSQEKAQEENQTLLDTGADQIVSLGAVNCVDALNKAGDGSEEAEGSLAGCLVELEQAKAMKLAANKSAELLGKPPRDLAAVDDLLNSDRASRIFGEFEEKYGASGEDLARKLIGEGFSASDLEGLLSKKIPPEKFQELVAAAEAEAAKKRELAQSQFTYDLKGPGKKSQSLRDKLKETLKKEAAAAARKPSSAPVTTAPRAGDGDYGGLKPLSGLFPSASGTEEINLFQVVRRKYREKWEMLVPYRAPR